MARVPKSRIFDPLAGRLAEALAGSPQTALRSPGHVFDSRGATFGNEATPELEP